MPAARVFSAMLGLLLASQGSALEVMVSRPRLTGGTIPAMAEALDKSREAVAQCVARHGGLSAPAGRIDVRFLVRERGRAEAVEVTRALHVEDAAGRCVQKLLKNRWIGTPSDDPVGVSVGYRLKRR